MKQTVLASPPLSLLKLGRYTRAEAFVPGSAFVGLRFELKATKQIQERVEYASSKAWQWTTDEEWIHLPNLHEARELHGWEE